MKNKANKQQKSKRKGSENAFGCDLTEHLQSSGLEVPHVLKTCAEFIEEHGIVDGIYRLSGITSNIQRLRQEFSSELCPDLTREVYLQDIHCVGSLCKLYFRELPNPLLTYQLYKKFTDAVSVKEEHEQLQNIQSVIKELPESHFKTLEYLAKHLSHLATLSHQTNMHTRNLALVWAPNLLRSKEIEVSSCNGDEAFLEVRVQQSVVEFILNHTEQIFNHGDATPKPKAGPAVSCMEKYATLPASSQGGPMKLMSLEEAQARSLSPNHPARRERQRENSLPDTSTAAMYHTVIELAENKRKFSGKSKKWKAIFSLGRSVTDAKGKLSRNGSVFMRTQNSEKTGIRPSKSMDSLCSQPADEDKSASAVGANGFLAPVVKSRTLGSDINYDSGEQDPKWEFDLRKSSGVIGGSPGAKRRGAPNTSSSSPPPPPSSSSSSSSSPLQRALPEQLKVFKGDDLGACQPTSPKNRRMLYSGSAHNGSSRPSFPGSLFPLESSPRHQRKALNISEPFAVSVPLRVSAVISSNSTPCRVAGKERERERSLGERAFLKPREAGPPEPHRSESLGSVGFRELVPSGAGGFGFRDRDRALGGSAGSIGYREYPLSDSSGSSGYSIYSNSSSVPMEKEKEESQSLERGTGDTPPDRLAQGKDSEVKEHLASVEVPDSLTSSQPKATATHEMPQSTGKELDTTAVQPIQPIQPKPIQPIQPIQPKTLQQLDIASISHNPWPDMHHSLQITEPETNLSEGQTKAGGFKTKIAGNNGAPSFDPQAKRRSSLPTHPVSSKGHFTDVMKGLMEHHAGATVFNPKTESSWNYLDNPEVKKDHKSLDSLDSLDLTANKLHLSPFFHLKETDILQDAEPWPSSEDTSGVDNSSVDTTKQNEVIKGQSSGSSGEIEPSGKSPSKFPIEVNVPQPKEEIHRKDKEKKCISRISVDLTSRVKGSMKRLSECLDERRPTSEILHHDDEDIWGNHLAGLDQVEPWEDLSTTKQWVTSPLHSPKLEDLFPMLKPSVLASVSESKATQTIEPSSDLEDKKVMSEEPLGGNVTSLPEESAAQVREPDPAPISPSAKEGRKEPEVDESGLGESGLGESGLGKITEIFLGANFEGTGETETKDIKNIKPETPQLAQSKASTHQEEASRIPKRNVGAPKQKSSVSSQRFHRQISHEPCIAERNEENFAIAPKHRPYSLNLDLGHRCIRDISNRQNLDLTDSSLSQRGAITPSGTGLSLELEMFLKDRQAPMRRNSAPVSVSSVRTAFMIKTCQAKAVPVIPPKIQYSQIPHPVHEKGSHDPEKRTGPEREPEKSNVEKADPVPQLQVVKDCKDCKEERENCEPVLRIQWQPSLERPTEIFKPVLTPDPPVLRRKRSANGDSFKDCPRPERSTLLQRSSFRNRPRPQSLILFSPPFPIMDYHPVGEDGKLVLSPIKSPTETSPLDVFTKELGENLKTPEGVVLRNKMTLPKSGQRLETSTSCFYQPQRRSMIFDSRSNRQIE
ncbi:rho GTPase-activating protein 31 [Astyanax mexicanus]|uniref:rho GTPase-activating protein 31 n=1 Tax=Astyanax mexicanus TaxID=7994 RepID=UPI0020CAF5D5|nr:rho GTPase-activating protein 31 [Astyanax mexicanus]